MSLAIIRYPGGKEKHLPFLRNLVHKRAARTGAICEPFAGGAAVTLDVLKHRLVDRYQINDFDPAIADLHTTVRDDHERLIREIEAYTPAVEDFYEFKSNPGDDTFERAFRKVVLHQISFSGLGAMAGGPLGGREQKSAYGVDCRWRPAMLAKKINLAHDLLTSVPGEITNETFEEVVPAALDRGDHVYLDPPYWVAGEALYLHGSIDHGALAVILATSDNRDWVLSYDHADEVRRAYQWADVQPVSVHSGVANRAVNDALILPLEVS